MLIKSILDNDLYKFSMQQAVTKLYPRAEVEYKFFNRGKTYIPGEVADDLVDAVYDMETLFLTNGEEEYLRDNLYFFDPVYIDFLKGFKYNSDEVKIWWDDGKLDITIEGLWYRTILWEVPLMAMISELYFIHTGKGIDNVHWGDIENHNEKKRDFLFDLVPTISLADFGTRRRHSYKSQDRMVRTFSKSNHFVGTSNVRLAHRHGIKPIGTQAHEWFMFHAAKYGFHQANSVSLGRWVDVYNGELGIALTDTFTTKNFFNSFDTMYAKLFDGVRHDSGDPIEFGERAIEHYKKLGIDPRTKTIVFSDGLNPKEVERINKHFGHGRIKLSYGVGTNLSNDIPGVTPLNIVIKMVSAKPHGKKWIPTIKLSDVEGKHTGDPEMIELAKKIIENS
jgi:nicotinate phosphoribosyltransferase